MIEVNVGGSHLVIEPFPEPRIKEGGNPDDPRDFLLPIFCEPMVDGSFGPMTKWWYFDRTRNRWQAHEHIL